ncbi:MAG: YdcH family protein [Pseudomonadota bacterium]
MLGEHHTLVLEFPEQRDHIHELKVSDNHFHRLMEEYDELTKKIERLEQEGEPLTDESMEDLKKRRLELKDELYTYLK